MNPNTSVFGLRPVDVSPLQLPRTILPLKSIRYEFNACGGMAEVEVTQLYRQENPVPLNCEYVFPLPADAAVYRCEILVDGRSIVARIEERVAAQCIAAAMRDQGFRTALVESERNNLFTLSLGNLQPGDLVEVRLAYLQPLRRQGASVSLDLPLCPGIRYVPGQPLARGNLGHGVQNDTDQVPDASRVTPPRIDADHPDAAFVVLSGRIDAAGVASLVSSPSHGILVSSRDGTLEVTLDRGGSVADQDLALRWSTPVTAAGRQRGWVQRHQGDDFLLLELQAPERAESTGALPQDLYFLVDRSSSMEGMKWKRAVQALLACVEAMSPTDRAMVTFFESSYSDFSAGPVPVAELRGNPRFHGVESMGTDGGTEMLPAVSHVLELVRRHSSHRMAALVLITDGQVANEREMVAALRDQARIPVHCFGIDMVLNDGLLLDLVRQQGGTFHSFHPNEDIAAAVSRLGSTLKEPVLVNFSVPPGWDLAGSAIPNLYAGQVRTVSLRRKGGEKPGFVSLTGYGRWNEAVSLQIELTSTPAAFPRLRWQKEQLVSLAARNQHAAAVQLSREANLLCEFTAFVAWDEAERVARAARVLVQPAQGLMMHATDPGPKFASRQALRREHFRQSSVMLGAEDMDRQRIHGFEPPPGFGTAYKRQPPAASRWIFEQSHWIEGARHNNLARQFVLAQLEVWSTGMGAKQFPETVAKLGKLKDMVTELGRIEVLAELSTSTPEERTVNGARAAELFTQFCNAVTEFLEETRRLLAERKASSL